jgi:hypothetical protein
LTEEKVGLNGKNVKSEMSTIDWSQTDSARIKTILLDLSNAFTDYRKEEYQ